MFQFEFMRIAFAIAIMLGVTLPLLGSTVVFKRLSSSGDALAHSALAGVAIGLAAGFNTFYVSIGACFAAFLIIEFLRNKFSKYSELGVAVVLSLAIGLAGILSSYTSVANFDSYLFGSIILVEKGELFFTIGLTVVVVGLFVLFFPQIFLSLYSESEAKVAGIKVRVINFVQSLLLAITVAVGAKIVGSLVVSSILVLPVAIALLFKKGYKFTIICSVASSVVSMITGLIISYYCDLKPGATIVVTCLGILAVVLLYKIIDYSIRRLIAKKKE